MRKSVSKDKGKSGLKRHPVWTSGLYTCMGRHEHTHIHHGSLDENGPVGSYADQLAELLGKDWEA